MEKKYTVQTIPAMRRFSVDNGWLARQRHTVHGLIEMDVTEARRLIQLHKDQTGETISFTAFIITCLARAVDENKEVSAYRDWRGRLVIFDEVNINTMIEVESGGRKTPIPHIFHAANQRTLGEVHAEMRETQNRPAESGEMRFMTWFLHLPAFIRHIFYKVITRQPLLTREIMSPVMVTAVGMFGKGGGWGIPAAVFPLTVTLGGIAIKPGVVSGKIEVREFLDVTLSFDHDIIDGAPAARFSQRFRDLVEGSYGLREIIADHR
jgi:pyruvate/2-oxoglutarate dehydrogenase complex dihydrolipoamide acyltransferase (E2) component